MSDQTNPTSPSTATVHVVTDSSCDLPVDVADELGIDIIPLTIRFGDEEFPKAPRLPEKELHDHASPLGHERAPVANPLGIRHLPERPEPGIVGRVDTLPAQEEASTC